jgi:hypothetical protein
MAPKKTKRAANRTPQIKLTIPESLWRDVREAMEYDGATKASQFALAALVQRVRRIKAMKALESKKSDI